MNLTYIINNSCCCLVHGTFVSIARAVNPLPVEKQSERTVMPHELMPQCTKGDEEDKQ